VKDGRAAKQKRSPAIEFVLAALKKNPKVAFSDLAEQGKKQGLKIVPVVYGRARVMAGLSPRNGAAAKKRNLKRSQSQQGGMPTRGPGRPRKLQAVPGLEVLISRIRDAEADRARWEVALRQIRGILDRVL
jgi:hypothetical protein